MSDAELEAGAEASASEPAMELDLPARRRGREGAEDPEAARKRLLFVVPLVMAAAALAAVVLLTMQDKGVYSEPVDRLLADKAKFLGRPVRAEGNLVHGSLTKRDSPCEFRFRITKNGAEIPVRYPRCIVPDTFRDVPDMDVGVTVEGQLLSDNSLEATAVMAKCPSKYDMKQKAANGEKAPHTAVPAEQL